MERLQILIDVLTMPPENQLGLFVVHPYSARTEVGRDNNYSM